MSIISLSRVFLSNLIKTTWLCFPQYFILRERMKVVKDIMKRIFLLKWSNAGGTQWKAKKSPKSDWLWSWWLKTCPFSRKDAKEWLVQPYRSRIPMPLIISLDWQYLSQSNTSILAHHIRTEPKNRAWVLLSLEWFFFFFLLYCGGKTDYKEFFHRLVFTLQTKCPPIWMSPWDQTLVLVLDL